MLFRSSFCLFLSLISVGCGRNETTAPPTGADASTALSRTEPYAISVLRAHASLVGRAGVGGALSREGKGLRLASPSGFRSSPIDAVLPAHADEPLRLAVPGRTNAW